MGYLLLVDDGCEDSVRLASGALMSEKAEACFVLPLRDAVAHFARRCSTTRWGALPMTTGIDMSANFRVGILPRRLGEPGGARFWLLCCLYHERRKVPSSSMHGLLTLLWSGLPVRLGIDIRNPNIDNAVCGVRPSQRSSLRLWRKRRFAEFSLFSSSD
jgi:hypothetical protein